MTDDASFVAEIRRAPDDIVPRLIYADFLEDNGDPRGEFIRIQCQLSEMPPGSAGRSELLNRERELLSHSEGWLKPLRKFGAQGLSIASFERGLLERIRINATDYRDHAAELFAIAPALQQLDLRKPTELSRVEINALSFPDQITALDLSGNHLDTMAVQYWMLTLLVSSKITALNISRNSLDGSVVTGLTHVPVTHLKAAYCKISGESVAATLKRLNENGVDDKLRHRWVSLDLSGNPLGDTFVTSFTGSTWPALRSLNLASCGITSIAGFADAARFPALQELILRDNRLTDWHHLTAEQEKFLRSLKTLDLRNNGREKLESHGI